MMLRMLRLWTAVSLLAAGATAFRVPISDTDSLREVCSGMWGGKDAYIEVSFDPASSGQVAMVIYEWQDVPFLGVETPESDQGGEYRPKTYICTTSAVRSNLCSSAQLGSFITSLPSDRTINSTSIYTSALKFTGASGPVTPVGGDSDSSTGEDQSGGNDGDEVLDPVAEPTVVDPEDTPLNPSPVDDAEDAAEAAAADAAGWTRRARSGRYSRMAVAQDGGDGQVEGGSAEGGVQTYAAPINYPIRKTGYYCVGIVPVTLVNEQRAVYPHLDQRQSSATHAEYSGLVLFRNTFDGELPAVEYPKINFYLFLSVVYFTLGLGWGFLCWKHRDELLPMQYYISGTIVFLVIEMLAQFAYYRYINKHGGGASSIAFLFVIAILNAARNSLSFFLLLIVSMGLSVVTQSLGSVMLKVRILTGLHFIFGVLYSVGTVQVELDSAALVLVLFMIFPLAFTLTVFLMWIIVSLNGTILHLQARKQKAKLTQFQRLWRILVVAVIAIAAFFVVSSLSLSNRLDENYAPNNWKYRWILLDGSLGSIYLCVFAAIAWLWRPTANNRSFSMSQELAQDEDDADAEDYEIDNLEARAGLRPSQEGYARPLGEHGEGDGDEDERKRFMSSAGGEVREENVVFQMGDDSDEEGEDDVKKGQGRDGYTDMDRSGSESEGEGDEAAGKNSKRRNS